MRDEEGNSERRSQIQESCGAPKSMVGAFAGRPLKDPPSVHHLDGLHDFDGYVDELRAGSWLVTNMKINGRYRI